MFELSGVNYEEVLEQGDSILVRVIASLSYRGFEFSGLYCIMNIYLYTYINLKTVIDTVLNARKSFLSHKGNPWIKKNSDTHLFPKVAEVCELAGLFMPHKYYPLFD